MARMRLSLDQVLTDNDPGLVPLDEAIPPLMPRQSHEVERTVRIPGDLPAGVYSIGVFADANSAIDQPENNDAGLSSTAIVVSLANGAFPKISGISPDPTPLKDGPQEIQIIGSGFQPGATVTLSDLTSGEKRFNNRPITSLSEGAIEIDSNFTTDAMWAVEVVNPGGISSGQYQFNVGDGAPTKLSPPDSVDPPIRADPKPLPEEPPTNPSEKGLIFITHGWNAAADSEDFWPWQLARKFAFLIEERLEDEDVVVSGNSGFFKIGDITIQAYDWGDASGSPGLIPKNLPTTASDIAFLRGSDLGLQFRKSSYTRICLIGHSAGSWLVDAIADSLKGTGKDIYLIALDAFEPYRYNDFPSLYELGDNVSYF